MSSEKKPQPAFSPEALRELSEENSDQLSEWYRERFGEPDSRGRWKERAEAAEARVAQLEAALRDARDEVEHWGQYASKYLQEKHGLKQALATIDRALLSDGGAK